ncbi:MAG TPA: sigma-54 dependent transcriptional regulator [Candidatus Saccharimonadales bacterium]|nr:sigma-54 dependent transcriptional regulator [Candidatus Saccharimonadales bacterium]
MILVVDDDPSVTASLGLLLKQNGREHAAVNGPDEALERLRERRFDLILQDMNFSRDTNGREGLDLLARIRELHPETPVILITAWGSIPLAVEGLKAGASDFVTKPWSNAQLMRSIETILSLPAARHEAAGPKPPPPPRAELDRKLDLAGIVGEDPEFLRVLEVVARVAPTDASVLITGESGTGKDLIAGAIHRNSRRRDGPLVKVNLGGISSTLFESEMFGHVRGAFTDARADRKGRFEVADRGTIFLDEIGELDTASQVKLLRVLQDRTFEVLGSSATRSVDVRVLSATNRDLAEAVSDGSFREDLYYRLNLITIRVPPLRARPGDIPKLAAEFLGRATAKYGTPPLALAPDAAGWLARQPWPGNIRQLQQAMERAVLVGSPSPLRAAELESQEGLGHLDERREALPRPGSMTLEQMERAMIANCMRHYGGNVSRAAEALGLSRAALYRRLEKHGITPGE